MSSEMQLARTPGRSALTRDARAWWFVSLLLVASTLYALWPLRHLVRNSSSFAFMYAAGRAWLHGFSPYDLARWRAEWVSIVPSFANGKPPVMPFVYPPHWAVIAAPLGLLSWPAACRVWDLVGVFSYVAVCAICVRHVQRFARRVPTLWLWTCVACAGFNGAVRWCLFEGQLALLPLLAVCGAFWSHHARRRGLVVACAFVASLKPQVSLLPLLFLFLTGAHKELFRAALLVAFASLVAMAPSGLFRFPDQFRAVSDLHLALDLNAPSEFFNISPLLDAIVPGRLALLWSWLLGGLMVVGIAQWSRRIERDHPLTDPLWQLGLLSAVTVAFTPQHGYDLVLLTPLVILASTFRNRWLSGMTLGLVLLDSRAHTLQDRFALPVFAPYVSLLILTMCLLELQRSSLSGAGRRVSAYLSRTSLTDPGRAAPSE